MIQRHDPALSVLSRWDGRTVTVRVFGDIDFATAGVLARHLEGVVSQQPDQLVIDLGQMCFIDAAGLRVIARARHALPEQCPVIFRSPARQVRKMIEVSGLITLCANDEPAQPGLPGKTAG